MAIKLENVDPNGLYGTATVAEGVDTAEGDPISLRDETTPRRDNRGRTLAITVQGHSLSNGVLHPKGRVDPTNDDGWADLLSQFDGGVLTNLDLAGLAGVHDDLAGTVVLILGADYAEIRIDSSCDSGTMDIAIAMGT